MDFKNHFITKTLIFPEKNKELLGKMCYNKKNKKKINII